MLRLRKRTDSANDAIAKVNAVIKVVNLLVFTLEYEHRNKPATVWDLEEGDPCWIITGKGDVMEIKAFCKHFERRREIGNVFLTEKEAKQELKQRIQIATSKLR